jgi:Dolichyl-phosphate-mannose-protein mannosyltransferase
MTKPAPELRVDAPDRLGIARFWPVALVLLLAPFIVSLNPMGYVGGGGDDWRYYEAAKCAAQYGWCAPDTHWAARWPLILPLSWMLQIFEEARIALSVGGGLFGAASLLLVMYLGGRLGGIASASVAGLMFITTPVVANAMIGTNVDLPELAFLLAGVACAWESVTRGKPGWAMAAGLWLALAVATRETAMAVIVPLAAYALWRRWWGLLLWSGAAFALPLAAEALWHWVHSSDPLLRAHLALAHASRPSSEIAGVPDAAMPLLNMNLVSRWQPSAGIHVYWLLDPWINLLANPLSGLTLIAAVALAVLGRNYVPAMFRPLGGVAFAASALLVYALAIDPKPRMFMFAIACAAIASGVMAPKLWRAGERLLTALLLGCVALLGMGIVYNTPNLLLAEKTARVWLAEPGFHPTMEVYTRNYFETVPGIERYPVGTARPLMVYTFGACPAGAVRAVSVARGDIAPIAWLRAHHILFGERPQQSLCLYR